jgi:hypothetical protein
MKFYGAPLCLAGHLLLKGGDLIGDADLAATHVEVGMNFDIGCVIRGSNLVRRVATPNGNLPPRGGDVGVGDRGGGTSCSQR